MKKKRFKTFLSKFSIVIIIKKLREKKMKMNSIFVLILQWINKCVLVCIQRSLKFIWKSFQKSMSFLVLNFYNSNSRSQTDPGRALLSRCVTLLATMLRQEVAVVAAATHRSKVQHTAVYIEVFQHRARNQAAVHPVVPKHYVSIFHLQKESFVC